MKGKMPWCALVSAASGGFCRLMAEPSRKRLRSDIGAEHLPLIRETGAGAESPCSVVSTITQFDGRSPWVGRGLLTLGRAAAYQHWVPS
jgi:hypothetical protein